MYPHALCSNCRADAAAPTRLATSPAPWFHPRRDWRLTLSMRLSGRADNAVHLGKRYAEGSSYGRSLQPRTKRRPDEVCLFFRYLGDVRVPSQPASLPAACSPNGTGGGQRRESEGVELGTVIGLVKDRSRRMPLKQSDLK